MLFGSMSENLISLVRMVKWWSGEYQVKNSYGQARWWFEAVSPVRELEKCVYWMVSWTDFTIETKPTTINQSF